MKSKKRTHAIYANSSLDDQEAITTLDAILAKTRRVVTDLKKLDSRPNTDGHIEIVDNGKQAGKFDVQVKKLSEDLAKKMKFSFEDESFFNYCNDQTLLPVLLICVDLSNDKAYWISMDPAFIQSLNGSKTIKLNASQIISKQTDSFVDDWMKIVQVHQEKLKKYDELKKQFEILSKSNIPDLGKENDIYIKIHEFLDAYNYLLDSKFNIVKKRYYANYWKIGFAYYKYEPNEVIYALYPIPRNKNDIQIKQVSPAIHDELEKNRLSLGFIASNPIQDNPVPFARKLIHESLNKLIGNKHLYNAADIFLAQEYIFAFIDRFYEEMGLEIKDEYRVSEVGIYLMVYLPFWVEEAKKVLLKKEGSLAGALEQESSFSVFFIDHAKSALNNKEQKEIHETVLRRVNQERSIQFPTLSSRYLPISILTEFIIALQNMGISGIGRPYIRKTFEIKNLYAKEDIIKNLRVFCYHLQYAYPRFISLNFPELQEELSLFKQCNRILFLPNLKNEDHYFCTMLYLASDSDEDHKITVVDNEKEVEKYEKLTLALGKIVEFEGKEYKIVASKMTVMDFLYEETPLLNYIYSLTKEKLESYFKK